MAKQIFKDKESTQLINIRLEPSRITIIDKLAAKHKTTRTTIIKQLIDYADNNATIKPKSNQNTHKCACGKSLKS